MSNIVFNKLLSILDENDCLDSLDDSYILSGYCVAGAKKYSDIADDHGLFFLIKNQ